MWFDLFYILSIFTDCIISREDDFERKMAWRSGEDLLPGDWGGFETFWWWLGSCPSGIQRKSYGDDCKLQVRLEKSSFVFWFERPVRSHYITAFLPIIRDILISGTRVFSWSGWVSILKSKRNVTSFISLYPFFDTLFQVAPWRIRESPHCPGLWTLWSSPSSHTSMTVRRLAKFQKGLFRIEEHCPTRMQNP